MTYPYVQLTETSLHLLRLYCRMRRQRGSMKTRLARLLANLHPEAASTLSPAMFQRMIKYLEIAGTVVCGGLARMQGRRLHEREMLRLQLLSVIAPLYDDLFDTRPADYSRIYHFSRYPADFAPANANEALLKEAYLRLLTIATEPRRVEAHFSEVYHWQVASKRQEDPAITEAELFRITYHKSYHAVLLFYTAFDRYPSPGETAMSFPMAGLMQLTNDMFDIWEDIRSGIYTVPILYRRYGRLEKRFLAESARFNQALARLPYPAIRKRRFAQTVHALHARGWLAVRHLRQEAKDVSDLAELALLGRKRLVCNMHKPAMLLAWAGKVQALTDLGACEGPTEPALKRDARVSTHG